MMNLFGVTEITYPVWQEVIINLLLAFILGLICSWVYRWTHRGFSYSISFVHTIILIAPITAFVMMIIGNSVARAFSLVGALSIIRFRTPLKDTKDTVFVFLALGIGFAAGTQAYAIAVIGVIIISLLAVVMHRIRLGESIKDEFLLRLRVSNTSDSDNVYKNIFDKYLKKNKLVNMATIQQGSFLELAYNITLKDSNQKQQFIRELNEIPELDQVLFVAVDEEEEY